LWAERQVATFVGKEQNPGLHELLNGSPSIAQQVEINVETNWLKALLVRLFMGSTRRRYPTEQHGRYFLVTKGFSGPLQEQIGMMNGMVGYVYLLDEACKIRWAGCGLATPDELTSLNNGIRRLIEQRKLSPTSQASASTAEGSGLDNNHHKASRRKDKVMT
jgi:ATPase complex subunit ATP10